MPTLHIVAQEAITFCENEGIALTALTTPNSIVSSLSAHLVAVSEQARFHFAYSFDSCLDLQVPSGPLSQLKQSDAIDTLSSEQRRTVERALERFETLQLKETADLEAAGVKQRTRCDVYTLYPVTNTDWVVGAWRSTCELDHPDSDAVVKNHAFFDALITNSLHSNCLEAVAQTNLFTYYLQSMTT